MVKKTVLVTGGSGMLATDVAAHLSENSSYHVITLPHARLDVTRSEEVEAAITAHRPAAVINTAALHVEDCEEAPAKAFAINAWGVRNLARACERHEAVFVQISTGALFGNEVRAYHEYDPVVLQTVYARSKYAGEEHVRQYCERHFILRLSWLYGGSLSQKKNFVAARYREAVQKAVVTSAYDKHGSPTYTGDVGKVIPALLESEEYGLYHVASQGGCNRAEYVRTIIEAFGLKTSVEEVDSSHFPRKARVPDCEILTSFNLGYAGIPLLPAWQESLDRYICSIRDEVDRL